MISYSQNLWIFFALLFGIIIVPGMDMFFVMASALAGGLSRCLAATFGIMLGGVFHTIFGAFFVGAIATLAPQLFTAILLAGAAYMAWIGYTLLNSAITVSTIGSAPMRGLGPTFVQGFVTCVLNPKAYVFVLAVYPNFIQPRFGPLWVQALMMGLLTIVTQFVIYGGLGVTAAKARAFLTGSPKVTIAIGRACGGIFIAVAALTIWHAVFA